MERKRVRAVDRETRELIAASYTVPDVVVAVQEAVYNAIDARAKRVKVVVDVAQASFSVADDGDGIHPDEMFAHLFVCAASSKTDQQTNKYGHRGQYLVALGTLAKEVEIESRIENYWTSFRKVVQNGRVVFNARSKTARASKGTALRVENLFRLLPVRQRDVETSSSSRSRVARTLNSFFQSLALIWPTLSIDVSFTDAKVPRCSIEGVPTCEARLRAVFGEILGRELEYISFGTNKTPFTIRGYAAVIRDGGDGDGHLESPGWRQARAYYQFCFLDNAWFGDFQRLCCKTINTTALALELGIPIFVIKISAKTHEYDRHSDGQTQIVNLKRPEMLKLALRGFVQHLKSRLVEAEAAADAMRSITSDREEEMAHAGSADSSITKSVAAGLSQREYDAHGSTYTETRYGVAPDQQLHRDSALCGDELWMETSAFQASDEEYAAAERYREHEIASYPPFHDEEELEILETVGYYSDEPYLAGTATSHFLQQEQESGQAYGSYEYGNCYSDDRTETSLREAHGCSHCRSWGSQTPQARAPGIHQHDLYLEYRQDEVGNEWMLDEGSYGAIGASTGTQSTVDYRYEPQFLDYYYDTVDSNPQHLYTENLSTTQSESQATLPARANLAPTKRVGVKEKHEVELNQIFFGKWMARKPLNDSSTREITVLVNDMKGGVALPPETWLSSRRLGVARANEELTQVIQPSTRSETGELTAVEEEDDVETCTGSHQLSDYFSIEKIVSAHKRSLGAAISRFASKRTALAGATAFGPQDRASDVHVRKLPSDLHAPSTKSMALDKSIFSRLQVIKQVDRKFILVKAQLDRSHMSSPSLAGARDNGRSLLLCIDQHAADERVRLEEFERQLFGVRGDERNMDIVSHDPPLRLSLNDREWKTLDFFADEIQSWGFEFETTKQTLRLTQTPRIDTRVANGDDFREYLQLLARSDTIIARCVLRPPVITRFLHSRACRSAIMFGDYLSFSQCEDIVEQLGACQLPFQCAHGRPSIVPLVELL